MKFVRNEFSVVPLRCLLQFRRIHFPVLFPYRVAFHLSSPSPVSPLFFVGQRPRMNNECCPVVISDKHHLNVSPALSAPHHQPFIFFLALRKWRPRILDNQFRLGRRHAMPADVLDIPVNPPKLQAVPPRPHYIPLFDFVENPRRRYIRVPRLCFVKIRTIRCSIYVGCGHTRCRRTVFSPRTPIRSCTSCAYSPHLSSA